MISNYYLYYLDNIKNSFYNKIIYNFNNTVLVNLTFVSS